MSPAPSTTTLSPLANGPNDSVAIPRGLADQQSLQNENILQVDPTTGGMTMRRSSGGSLTSFFQQFPHRDFTLSDRSPSPSLSRSNDHLPSEEPPPAYAPPPMDELVAGRQSREGSVDRELPTTDEIDSSPPPPAYAFPPTDDWGMDEVDTFKTEC